MPRLTQTRSEVISDSISATCILNDSVFRYREWVIQVNGGRRRDKSGRRGREDDELGVSAGVVAVVDNTWDGNLGSYSYSSATTCQQVMIIIIP